MRIDREPSPWAVIRDKIRAQVADNCIICHGTESDDEPQANPVPAGEE